MKLSESRFKTNRTDYSTHCTDKLQWQPITKYCNSDSGHRRC